MSNGYIFSETEANKKELQQYREDSDSVLSFIRECCVLNKDYSVGSTELFNVYKAYCEECGLKPYSHRMFVQQLINSNDHIERNVDKLGKRRILTGIKLDDRPQ